MMRTSPVHSPNFTGHLNGTQKTYSSKLNAWSSTMNNELRFSGKDSLQLQRTNSSRSSLLRKTKEKLEEIFGESENAKVHSKPEQVDFALIQRLALNSHAQEEFLEPFSPSLTDVEAAQGEFASNRVLVRFSDKASKDTCLSFIPGRRVSFSNLGKQPIIQAIQLALNFKRYTIANNIDTDGTVIVSRTEELYPKNKEKLKNKDRCLEQKKYIIHTSHPALGPEEVAVELQIALKTQAEIKAEQSAASPKDSITKRWMTW